MLAQQQSQQTRQQSPAMQQQLQQQHQQPQQPSSNTRVIPIHIEGGSTPQSRSPAGNTTQNKFNPMTPQSPTPYSPSQDR